jgi:LPXTG-site transpeptidase (sortase) family protein
VRSVVRLADPPANLLGSVLIGLGVILLTYALGMYLDLVPGGRVSVPPPVALERARPPRSTSIPTTAREAAPEPTAESRPAPVAESRPAPESANPVVLPEGVVEDLDVAAWLARPDPSVFTASMVPADAPDRPLWRIRPAPGHGVELRIPSINLSTGVASAGVTENSRGILEWETVPFLAAHYVDTALVGASGNAVLSGHVVTLYEGNVFRHLYQVEFGARVEVDTADATFVYEVDDVRVVAPTDTDVMESSDEPRLTLITCGGEFNPRTTQFSHRLVVGGRLVDWSRRVPA